MDSLNAPPALAGHTLLQRLINSDIPKTRFFQLLTSPWNPPAELTSGITSQASEDAMTMEPHIIRPDPERNPMMLPLHQPTGAWKWATGLGIRACTNVIHLESDKKNSMYFGTGTIGKQDIQFICRTWPLRDDFPEFTSELGLFKSQLKPLLGTYVPNIIGVYTGIGLANILMELPHPAFWIEASPDMPDVLKRRCIECYQKLHDVGVLHGAPHPRNILVGGDARVTIVNFGDARVLDPIIRVNQRQTTAAELRLEMRKVKFQLNYGNAREKEKQKWADSKQRTAWNRAETQRAIRRPGYVMQLQEEPEEDKLDPPVDIRKTRGWVDGKYESKRFVVPTISSQAFAHAAEKFIANIRRMEREGDGSPPSRSPSPPRPSIQAVHDAPPQSPTILEDHDLKDIDKSSNSRHSLRKRKSILDTTDTDSPLSKRQKVATGAARAAPLSTPITLESFINKSAASPVIIRDASTLHTAFIDAINPPTSVIRVRDFAYEPTPQPSNLRSALKSPPKPLLYISDEEDIETMSVTARGKRKREDDEEDQHMEEDDLPTKRARAHDPHYLPTDAKRVSFAPAPDVFLKKYTIPPHLFTKPRKRGERLQRRRARMREHMYEDEDDSDSEAKLGGKPMRSTVSLFSRRDFTFTSHPFHFVSRWISDIFHSMHW